VEILKAEASIMMWRLISAVFVLLVFSAAPALADSDHWSKTFEIAGQASLHVDSSDASIRIEPWEKNQVEATITSRGWGMGNNGIKVEDHQAGDSVDIRVRFPHHWVSIGDRSVKIEIRAPKRTVLNLHTGDGGIDVNGIVGDITADTGDGHIHIQDADGSLHATTGDGKIEARGRFDALYLKTGDGHIEASALSGSRMSGAWSLKTGDGSVTLRLPEAFAADVEIHTNDGHIDLGFPVEISGRMGSHEIKGKINGGGGLLSMRTGDGSIHVEKL
jgi:DUF4097 and DUF4098 domain-containing protein YvlB